MEVEIGSLFSLCQAVASPVIGTLSDKYGRRTALLWSMAGNVLSVALWVAATDFRTFLASRIVGGLSEGNVQLAMAIATDISDDAHAVRSRVRAAGHGRRTLVDRRDDVTHRGLHE